MLSRYSASLKKGRSGDRIPINKAVEIFRRRTKRACGLSSPLHTGYWVIARVKMSGVCG